MLCRMNRYTIYVQLPGSGTCRPIIITPQTSAAELEFQIRTELSVSDGQAVMLLSNIAMDASMAYPLPAFLGERQQDLAGRMFQVSFCAYEEYFSSIRAHPGIRPQPGWEYTLPEHNRRSRSVHTGFSNPTPRDWSNATNSGHAPAAGGSSFAPRILGLAQNLPQSHAHVDAQPGFSHANTPHGFSQDPMRNSMHGASLSDNTAGQKTEPSVKIEEDDGTVTDRKPGLDELQDRKGSEKGPNKPHGENYGSNRKRGRSPMTNPHPEKRPRRRPSPLVPLLKWWDNSEELKKLKAKGINLDVQCDGDGCWRHNDRLPHHTRGECWLPVKCWTCGREGHYRGDCPIKCRSCSHIGHIERRCLAFQAGYQGHDADRAGEAQKREARIKGLRVSHLWAEDRNTEKSKYFEHEEDGHTGTKVRPLHPPNLSKFNFGEFRLPPIPRVPRRDTEVETPLPYQPQPGAANFSQATPTSDTAGIQSPVDTAGHVFTSSERPSPRGGPFPFHGRQPSLESGELPY